jgi:leader peptidase (prepilin peptidase)/N-methyltransferase
VIEIVIAFVAGLLLGSFLNVCAYRLPRDLSVSKPARSFCPECEKTIAWYDNIPLLSFLILRGRCRNCTASISWRYPLLELATGLAFAFCAAKLGFTAVGAKYAVFVAILITLIATDFETQLLPDEFTLGGTAVGLVFAAFVPMDPGWAHLLFGGWFIGISSAATWLSIGESVLGACVCGFLFWLMGWLYEKIRHREGMGLGDVKMIAMIGAFLGLQAALFTLVVASLTGAIGGLTIAFATRKKVSTYEVPFGVYLGIAAIAVAIYGRYLMGWYSQAGN